MKNIFLEEKKPLILLSILYLVLLIITWGHCGDLITDCGREAYIPYAISKGSVLYRDIFCIYGPFPYLFNTFFYKIFTLNLSVLYIIGGIFGAFYMLGLYLCSREFLSKLLSLSICVLVMLSVVFSTSIFNFIFPYSYAMVFSATFAIWILYNLLRYIKTKEKSHVYTSFVLWGAICASKPDFVLIIVPILLLILLYGKEKISLLVRALAFSLIIPTITFLVLFAQGLRISDIVKNSNYLTSMIKSHSLAVFYSNYSLLSFNSQHFFSNLVDLIALIFLSAIFFAGFFYILRLKNKKVKYALSALITVFFYFIIFLQEEIPEKIFALLPYICTLIFAYKTYIYVKSKDYKNVHLVSELTLILVSLLCTIKNFHSLILGFYGAYSLAGLLLVIVLFIKNVFENNILYNTKRQYENVLALYIGIITLLFLHLLFAGVFNENTQVKTKFGGHKTSKNIGQAFNETLDYLNQHGKDNSSLVVLPEGIMLNFLSGYKWDFYQTSFIPLDFDAFKEDNIIKDIAAKKPDFVVFTSRNTSEYGSKYICRDYGFETCKYIIKNYTLEAAFGDKFRIFIFKLRRLYENEKEN